jgi:hypothetical protein
MKKPKPRSNPAAKSKVRRESKFTSKTKLSRNAPALPSTREEPQSRRQYRRPENVRGRMAPVKAREVLRAAMQEHTEADDRASWEAIEEDLRNA